MEETETAFFVLSHAVRAMRTTEQVGQLLRGAFVILVDDGAELPRMIQARGVKPTAFSSHHSVGPQYRLGGRRLPTILVGAYSSHSSWVQLERHSMGMRHFADYMRHVMSGLNVGPYGTSGYTEKRPLSVRGLALPLPRRCSRALTHLHQNLHRASAEEVKKILLLPPRHRYRKLS